MTLQKLLFEPTLLRSPARVVGWWESRRPMYNLIVGATGLGTLAYIALLQLLLGDGWNGTPLLLGAVVYGVVANLCYTLGSAVELAVEKWMKRPVYGLGPALFRHGLVFSVGLTLLPAAIVTVAAVGGLLFR